MKALTVAKNTALAALALVVASCAQAPIKPSPTHIQAEEVPAATGTIPPPVQVAPVLPKPEPTVRPETYSVVVNNVRVHDLLFALARDAKINVDVHPDVSGTVTLNAIDQTLTQLLARISKQVDMRYELDGPNLLVMRDTPFLRLYKIDYLSATRNAKMQSTASTQFGQSGSGGTGGGAGGGGSGGAGSSSATGGTATIDVSAENKLWESVVQNVKEILRETDKVIPTAVAGAAPRPATSAQPAAGGAPASQAQSAPLANATYQEAASVIANRETGVLYVRATSRQHEKVQEFVDQVLVGAKRQVLIEVSVAEVQLRNEYQRGIEWQRLRSGVTGLEFRQPSISPPSGFNTNPFLVGYASGAYNFTATLKLLEQFGDVKVLSSPKLSVLNNQTAILRVTRDIIYFTLTPSSTPVTVTGGGAGIVVPVTFTTTPNIAAEGFMMSVMPQINDVDAVVLSVRPTIRRQVGEVRDPNPALQGAPTQNPIPLFETREFDSILRLQSGQVAVLAGLMQDQVENTDTGIPGIRSIPLIGPLLSQRSDLTRKTELVIFIRASVIRDPSIDGDYRSFRALMPTDDFLRRPNPQRIAPPIGPSGEALK